MDRYKLLPTYRYYEAEGYPLSLGKTAGKPLRNYRIYGNTVDGIGVGSPAGKNLFDAERWYNELRANDSNLADGDKFKTVKGSDGNYDYIQTCGANNKINLHFMKGEFKQNTRYAFSFTGRFIKIDNSGTGNAGIQFYYEDGTNSISQQITSSMTDWTTRTHITTSGKTLSYIRIYGYSPSTIFQLSNVQLEEGTTVTSYEPYKASLPILLDNQEVANIQLNQPLKDGEYIDYKADKLPEIPTKKFQTNTLTVQSTVPPSKIWCEYYK